MYDCLEHDTPLERPSCKLAQRVYCLLKLSVQLIFYEEHLLTLGVEVILAVGPRQLGRKRCKHVVERPTDDHVVVDGTNERDYQHPHTNA